MVSAPADTGARGVKRSTRIGSDPDCPAAYHGTYSAVRKQACCCPEALADMDAQREVLRVQSAGRKRSGRVRARTCRRQYVAALSARIAAATDRPCASGSPNVWFPDDEDDPMGSLEARWECRRCPVRQACLNLAVIQREPHGIWGGLSTMERKQMQPSTIPVVAS